VAELDWNVPIGGTYVQAELFLDGKKARVKIELNHLGLPSVVLALDGVAPVVVASYEVVMPIELRKDFSHGSFGERKVPKVVNQVVGTYYGVMG
jgi:hypothetical protein